MRCLIRDYIQFPYTIRYFLCNNVDLIALPYNKHRVVINLNIYIHTQCAMKPHDVMTFH